MGWEMAALAATAPTSLPPLLALPPPPTPHPTPAHPCRRYADVVAHRQLLAAVAAVGGDGHGTALPSPGPSLAAASLTMPVPPPPPPPPPLGAAEVSLRAAVMNERHRAAKRAQKECSDLYLLLLLHAQVKCGEAAVGGALLLPQAAHAVSPSLPHPPTRIDPIPCPHALTRSPAASRRGSHYLRPAPFLPRPSRHRGGAILCPCHRRCPVALSAQVPPQGALRWAAMACAGLLPLPSALALPPVPCLLF